ncbi:MAG TPA: class I SAM-dependent methyltransferase [Rubrobacter sp.]|nr:class I SAM-dependent methyltransferase [Rubrobacter sp.]
MDHNWGEILHRFEQGPEDHWLERWQTVLETSRDDPILELGCGSGQDARFLTGLGFAVIATDLSEEALELTRRRAPDARVQNVDLTRRLPFPDAAFRVIVASLSLHYFLWRQTLEILDDVRRCLRPHGHLLARLNSTRDPHYSAAEKQEIEANFYLVGGMPKRLFDGTSVDDLFENGWEIVEANERMTRRYGEEKLVWEVAARKADC